VRRRLDVEHEQDQRQRQEDQAEPVDGENAQAVGPQGQRADSDEAGDPPARAGDLDQQRLDAEGKPIESDPNLYFQGGGILPLGGSTALGAWKGFGLALMVDALAGALSDGGASTVLPSPQASHFFAAVRIDAFTTREAFLDRIEEMKAKLRSAPRQAGAPPLTFAGEAEAALEAERRRDGVPLHPAVIAALQQMCGELGIEYDL